MFIDWMFGMIKKAFARVSLTYVKVARAFFLTLLFVSPVILVAYSQQPGTVTLAVKNVTTNPGNCGMVGASIQGTVVVVSGSYSGQIHFKGNATLVGTLNQQPQTANAALSFNGPINYPPQNSTGFYGMANACFDPAPSGTSGPYPGYSLQITAYDASGNQIGSLSVTSSTSFGSSNAMYILIVQLPLINDSMLGATVQSGSPTIGPLGGMYNFILAIGLILVIIGALLAVFLYREKVGMGTIIMNAVTSTVAIFLFPLIYNEVATLVNAMDVALITFPNFAPTPDAAISAIWNAASFGGLGSFWGIIWTGFTEFAVWLMELIAWLMMNFLGIIRLFLISILLVAFPLSMGLRLIPFTQKLSQMVDDTLYGLILASIMSALVLGVAANIINNYQGSMFQAAIGNQPDWVAIAAIFAAILMPTVFAPLTGIMMQTVSQTAMAGAGVATMVGAGLAMPGGAGAVAGMRAGMAALGTATQAAGAGGLGLGGTLKTFFGGMTTSSGEKLPGFLGTFKGHALRPMLSNAVVLGTVGTLGALGATAGAKQLAKMMPVATHADVLQSVEAAKWQKYVENVGDVVGISVPLFAAPPALPQGLQPPVKNEAILNLQKIARSDDFAGAYSYLHAHGGGFGLKDLPHPASAPPEVKQAIGARFIQALRPYKDNEEALRNIVGNMNTSHQHNQQPPQPHP
jgi:hypothetical protein